MSEATEKRYRAEVNPRQGGKTTMLALASELVKKQREIERKARVIKLLEDDLKEALGAIQKHCDKCWDLRKLDPAVCRACAFWEFKEDMKRYEMLEL